MKFTIDRFEGNIAIIELEDGRIISIPKDILPIDAKEGDIISTIIEKDETEKRKKRIRDKFSLLLNNKEDEEE